MQLHGSHPAVEQHHVHRARPGRAHNDAGSMHVGTAVAAEFGKLDPVTDGKQQRLCHFTKQMSKGNPKFLSRNGSRAAWRVRTPYGCC